jgi:DNA mismatch repair protein MutL
VRETTADVQSIRFLDEILIGQIAAGEIIERPMSVVKELVENALDAGARRIEVRVEDGGLSSITVADDGEGIVSDELPLAVARHATSKLRVAGDLSAIATLGFRGEGLASIVSVADVRIVSRRAGEQIGYALEVAGESVDTVVPLAAPPGTRVEVRNLFGRVPARREYLRTPAAEFARISAFFSTLALGYPEVAFSLSHGGRTAFSFAADRAFEERLAYVFGPTWTQLLALEAGGDERASITGYVNRPGFERADRRLQHLFVNRRLLRSTALAGAWTAGYAGYAMSRRQPFGVLFVNAPLNEIDPNVHPTKSEVRFRRDAAIGEIARRAIRTALADDATARHQRSLSFAPPTTPSSIPSFDSAPMVVGARPLTPVEEPTFLEMEPHAERASSLRILAQLDRTYLLATDGRALVLVDQHAAHERIAYEIISERASHGAPSEPLLLPDVIELSANEAELLESSRETLGEAGLDIEPFGERVYRVVATPAGYGARAFDLRGYLADLSDEIPGLSARERIWATLACHSVVRAGHVLEFEEMAALIAGLERCRNPMHCPHGRPTIVRIEPHELARFFKRV